MQYSISYQGKTVNTEDTAIPPALEPVIKEMNRILSTGLNSGQGDLSLPGSENNAGGPRMSLRHALFCVDAFADRIGTGNPAGICLLDQPADPAWMQAVAREMNLSETAFVEKEKDGFGLRWFTPRAEVDLCGHATLGTAHILWEAGYLGRDDPARFFTKSGTLSAVKRGELIELDFPSVPGRADACSAGLSRALGIQPCYTGKNGLTILSRWQRKTKSGQWHRTFPALPESPCGVSSSPHGLPPRELISSAGSLPRPWGYMKIR